MTTELRCFRDFQIHGAGSVLLRDVARFVRAASQFSASVIVRCGHASADGKSMLQVSSLHLKGGSRFSVTAWGWDAPECLAELEKVIAQWSEKPSLAMAA
jgi:phosphotransferase system HPr (HPr) family protein